MLKKVGVILVNYKDYAKRFLVECRDSLRALDYPPEALNFYLVDNETSAESRAYLQENFSEAKIILNEKNDGFAKGNNDGIKAALADGCEYVWLLNLDTVVEPTALREMIKTAEADEKIGAVQARLMLWPDKNKINSLGNATHFLGFGYCLGYGEEWKGNYSATVQEKTHPVLRPSLPFGSAQGRQRGELIIMYPSGAAVLLKKEALEKVGLLDEEYWMYNEDQEIGWRLWLAGWKCVLASDAVVYHKFEFSRSISKFYWMDRNRILAIWECYEPLTLVLIAPAFLIMELGLTLFSLQSGWFNEKVKVWNYFLTSANWPYLKKARERNQALRQVRDRELACLITGKIWYQEIGDWKLRLVNPILNAYWVLARVLLAFF